MTLQDKKPRIFHGIVNYGTQSGILARELRNRGYDAISVTLHDQYKRLTDVELKHGGPLPLKFFKHLFNCWLLIKCFFAYDLFHFYYGSSLAPYQFDLPFYRLFRKKVVMEYLGNDIQGYQRSLNQYRWTNVSYMMNPDEGYEYDKRLTRRIQFERKYIDRTLVCAPIYSEFAQDSEVLPLAIDLDQFSFSELPSFRGRFRIMHAPTHRGFKGTDFIVESIEKLKNQGYEIDFDLVENVSHAELMERYRRCHLFIDQIMGGWYGTAAIEAMAIGRPVVVSIRKEYFQFIDYGHLIPVFHADPDIIESQLRVILDNGIDYLRKRGVESREFVEEYHGPKYVVDRLVSIYDSISNS